MDLRGEVFRIHLPLSPVCSGLSPHAGPFCHEGKASKVDKRSLSGSIHAKESTAACLLRAQGRSCVTARANSPHCSAKVHVWSKAKAFSYFYGSFPHQAFQTWICVCSGTGCSHGPLEAV